MNDKMKKNTLLVLLILEFVVIVILGICLFNNKTKNLPKEEAKCEYKEQINFLCTKVEEGPNSIYTHEAYVTTNIKGKIEEVTNIRKYKYNDQTMYNNYKKNNTKEDKNIKIEFIDKTQEMIITEPTQKEDFNINNYYSYETNMIKNNYKCELIEKD